MIHRFIDKALVAGVPMGLKDKYYRLFAPEINDEAKAWVISLACNKPKDHGLAAELWSISALLKFVCQHAKWASFERLAKAGQSTVWPILDEKDIKPYKIRYYQEKRDADFAKETMAYLASRTGRFGYVPTPEHGSWLKLIECAVSKNGQNLSCVRFASSRKMNLKLVSSRAWRRSMNHL